MFGFDFRAWARRWRRAGGWAEVEGRLGALGYAVVRRLTTVKVDGDPEDVFGVRNKPAVLVRATSPDGRTVAGSCLVGGSYDFERASVAAARAVLDEVWI